MGDAPRVASDGMTFLRVKRGKVTVAISEGGVSVLGKGWSYTCNVRPPRDAGKLTQAERDKIADRALKEFLKLGKEARDE